MSQYPGAARAGVSPNRSPRLGKVRLFIVHHYAGTTDPESAWNRFNRPNDRTVSPNYQVNADGSVFEVVPPDNFRAWTTGTIDHQAVTCETQNTTGAPTWGISRESHEAIARLIAWAAQRYGFPIQRGRVDDGDVVAVPGVVGHRETPTGRRTGTACPGPSMDLDWIVNRAQQIAGGSAAGAETKEWNEMDATQAAQLARVADFVDKLDEIRLFDGVPGVDLSTPRLRLALDASIDLRKRFVYVDEHGTPTYDLAQLAANEIKPMLLTLIAAIGRPATAPGAPIDPAALVSAIREALGDELAREVADELAARLAQ